MKKFLSLVLALVMTMSLVTISAGAKEFKDDDKITYDEAIAVISTIGVVDGYEDGSFNPQGSLTRGAAAKIICNMILGPTTATELHADTAPFKDVPVNHTFAGYIAYCAKEGIISGYADGTFRPAGTLTGYAFMKMLLGALGYDATIEGYTGANWSINVAKQALAIGLNKSLDGEFNGIKAVNREEAALYAFNTLKADLVEYETSLTVNNGTLNGLSIAKAQKWNNSATRHDYIKDDQYIQFAEQYFNKLMRDDGEDDFGRPTNEWTYNKKDIGSFVNGDLFVTSYTAKVKGGDIYTDIGSNACDFELTYWVDGVKLDKTATAAEQAKLVKKNDKKLESTGNGVLTEVFVNTDKEETTVVVINTWLAEVAADYSEKNENVRLNVFVGYTAGATPTTNPKTYTVSSDDVAGLEDLKEDDMVLVNIADDEVVIVSDVETVEEVAITSYSTSYDDADAQTDYKLTKLTADGTKYETAEKAYESADVLWDYNVEQLEDATYDLYLDPYGYVIGARKVDGDDLYMFVVGYEQSTQFLAKAIDKALVIFTDGTMETVDIKSGDLKDNGQGSTGRLGSNANINTWYEYTEKNGVYNLEKVVARQIKDGVTQELNKQNTTVTNGTDIAYGNNDSVLIAVKADKDVNSSTGSIVKVEDVATGIKYSDVQVKYTAGLSLYETAPSGTTPGDNMIFAIYDKNHYIDYAVVVGKSAGASEKMVYLTSGIKSKSLVDGDYIYTYEAITKDGAVEVQSFEAYDTAKNKLALANLYEASFNKDGIITELDKKTNSASLKTVTYKNDGYMLTTISGTAKLLTSGGNTLYIDPTVNDQYVLLDEDCKFFVRYSDDKDDEYEEYSKVESALSAIGEDGYFTGTIAAIVDEAGIATTLILHDTYKANDKAPSNIVPPVIYSDGKSEGIVAMNPTAKTITVRDRMGTGDTADEMIRAAFEKSNFTVDGNIGNTYYVTAPNGDIQNWTATVEEAYAVKIVGNIPADVSIKNATVYVASGDSISISVGVANGGNWSTVRNWTTTVTGSNVSVSTGTATGIDNVQTVPLTFSSVSGTDTVTLAWD